MLDTLHRMGDAAKRALPQVQLDAVGATIPGIADPVTGTWVEASFSGLNQIPVAEDLAACFHLPVRADNDGQACTLRRRFTAGPGTATTSCT
ncbi:MAG: hypothetical protein ACI4MK_09620 [Aristaeellaceae bacterium]